MESAYWRPLRDKDAAILETLQPQKDTRRLNLVSMNLTTVLGAPSVCLFAAKVGRGDFQRAAHLIQSRAHTGSDALLQGIFARRRNQFTVRKSRGFAFRHGVIEIVRRDNSGAVLVVSRVQDNSNDV